MCLIARFFQNHTYADLPPTSLEQFLWASWKAVSWAMVLSKSPDKTETHSSQVVHFYFSHHYDPPYRSHILHSSSTPPPTPCPQTLGSLLLILPHWAYRSILAGSVHWPTLYATLCISLWWYCHSLFSVSVSIFPPVNPLWAGAVSYPSPYP